jgi:acyl-CoA synthetase (NDP forming)
MEHENFDIETAFEGEKTMVDAVAEVNAVSINNSLDVIFKPKSIAIVGASDRPGFTSRVPNLLWKFGYSGQVFLVNPRYKELFGSEVYPSVEAVPAQVDLALLIIAAKNVLSILEECVAKGVKAAVIFSSGFAEMGEAGRDLQNTIKELCNRSGLRVLGPNCMGFFDLSHKLVVTASTSLMGRVDGVSPSSIAFITQSGALGTMTCGEACLQQGKSFRYFISTGNEVNVEVSECAAYTVDDPEVNVIGIYNESIKDPGKLSLLAKKAIQAKKPLVAVKVGKSSAGMRAAVSHTGSIVGHDAVYEAFFRQQGIIRAADIQELLDFMLLASTGRIPEGNRLGIMSVSGGAGIMVCDQCEALGIEVPELKQDVQEKIKSTLPSFAASANPVDITAEALARPELFKPALENLAAADNIDCVLVFFGLNDEMAPRLVGDALEVYKECEKPIVITWFAAGDGVRQCLAQSGLPGFREPGRAVRAINLLMQYRQILNKREQGILPAPEYKEEPSTKQDEVINWLRQLSAEGRTSLSEFEAKGVLEAYRIPVARGKLVSRQQDAGVAAEEIGFPLVLKIDSPHILHKTEAGCVILNVRTKEEAEKAFITVMENARAYNAEAQINGVLIEEMLSGGTELIIGSTRDATFGPTIMFGLGGVFVEVLKDVSARISPLTLEDAKEMIHEIKGFQVLQGARGKKPVNLTKLAELLVRVGQMAYKLRSMVEEIDINPLIISADGETIKAADALMLLKKH